MTTDTSNDTEPIILCNAGTKRADVQFGELQVHDFAHTTAHATLANLAPGLSERRKRMALEYIEANLSRDITLAEIAGAAALSPYHFSRSFKAAMGTTPVRYVWHRRVELAKRLLRTTMTLVDVAAAAGFGSQSSFTTAFRQATGATPAAWRRAI